MTLFIFTSSRELLRTAWEKWHPAAGCGGGVNVTRASGRAVSSRLATTLASAAKTLRDDASDWYSRN